jgi:hypothetical protein
VDPVASVGDRIVASLEAAGAEGRESHDQEIPDGLAGASRLRADRPSAPGAIRGARLAGWTKPERIDPK